MAFLNTVNIIFVLDISGSMTEKFHESYVDSKAKLTTFALLSAFQEVMQYYCKSGVKVTFTVDYISSSDNPKKTLFVKNDYISNDVSTKTLFLKYMNTFSCTDNSEEECKLAIEKAIELLRDEIFPKNLSFIWGTDLFSPFQRIASMEFDPEQENHIIVLTDGKAQNNIPFKLNELYPNPNIFKTFELVLLGHDSEIIKMIPFINYFNGIVNYSNDTTTLFDAISGSIARLLFKASEGCGLHSQPSDQTSEQMKKCEPILTKLTNHLKDHLSYPKGYVSMINTKHNIDFINMCLTELKAQLDTFDSSTTTKYFQFVKAIVDYVTPQVNYLIDNQKYTKWGNIWLISLGFALSKKYFTNENELYGLYTGSEFFHEKRIKIFKRLDTYQIEKKPSHEELAYANLTRTQYVPKSQTSSQARDTGCIHPDSRIPLDENGSHARIQDVFMKSVPFPEYIEAIVRYPSNETGFYRVKNIADGKAHLSLLITATHPIRFTASDAYVYPKDVHDAIPVTDNPKYVYNIIMKNRAPEYIANGIRVLALGHGLMGGVEEHSYYGTDACIQDLKEAYPLQYETKCITATPSKLIRDETTGYVIGTAFETL